AFLVVFFFVARFFAMADSLLIGSELRNEVWRTHLEARAPYDFQKLYFYRISTVKTFSRFPMHPRRSAARGGQVAALRGALLPARRGTPARRRARGRPPRVVARHARRNCGFFSGNPAGFAAHCGLVKSCRAMRSGARPWRCSGG
ncbi:MAG: hypothetical protein KDA21_03140, partial [Phycisphaerales bacterium]|nr:hypothetical protein [Phycisphaerales bacterium]